jgi:hypothetical protein
MTKQPKNAGKLWTVEEIKKLKQLAGQDTPTRVIALKLHVVSQDIVYS